MHPSQQLYELQALDLERDAKYRRLKIVIASLNEPEALRNAMTALAGAHTQVAQSRAQHRIQELEIQTLEAKIKSVEERLYSGLVKSPKELTDLQNDSASLRRHHATLDDKLLDAMIAVEDAEQAEKQAQEQLSRLQTEWRTNQSALTQERSQLEADIAALTDQRRHKMESIAPEHIAAYQPLRHAHAGQAVARIEDGTCVTCGVEISDRVLAKAKLIDALSFCTNCERILLVE